MGLCRYIVILLTLIWRFIYDQMRRGELREIFDALEEFVLLKRQNCMIYAWMEIKKRDRKLAGPLSSRAKSILSYRTSYKSCDIASRGHQQIYNNFIPFGPSHNSPYEDKASSPDHFNIKNSQQAKLSTHKSQGNSSPRQKEALSRRSIFGIGQQGLEFDDDDGDFQEIVIERLARLEQNIDQMMRDKKMKEREQSQMACTPIAKHKDLHDQSTVNAQESRLLYRRKRITGCLSDHQKTLKHTANYPKDAISNIKYIPVSKINKADLRQAEKQSKEQDNIIDNIDYFIVGRIRRKIDSPGKDLRMREHQNQQFKGNFHYFTNSTDIQAFVEPRYSHLFKTEPDLLFSPIKSKYEQINPSPKPKHLLKYSSSRPLISPPY